MARHSKDLGARVQDTLAGIPIAPNEARLLDYLVNSGSAELIDDLCSLLARVRRYPYPEIHDWMTEHRRSPDALASGRNDTDGLSYRAIRPGALPSRSERRQNRRKGVRLS